MQRAIRSEEILWCGIVQVKPPKAAKPASEAAQANGTAPAAAQDEAWRTADPFSFLPRPAANNIVHTSVQFRYVSVHAISLHTRVTLFGNAHWC